MADQTESYKKIEELDKNYALDKASYEALLNDKSKEKNLQLVLSDYNLMKATIDNEDKKGVSHTYSDADIKAKEDEIKVAKEELEAYKEELSKW